MAIAEPMLARESVELVDVTYARQGRGMVLRLLVDTVKGITLAECARLNEMLSQALDGSTLFEEPYTLEVSSPGLDRPLVTRRDFERVLGRRIEVATRVPVQDKSFYRGTAIDINDEAVTVVIAKGEAVAIPLSAIQKATLEITFR
ncbi:MAG: ribosome maturation factor RimP [Candidatus Omnitrophica bacterium]|nr:ribosome maturation factor RimP [Candidatus Omnitrophota bacterium]